jgi:hypothetical protein
MHQINSNGQPTALQEAINLVRAEQVQGRMGYGYIFSGTRWLWGGVWYAETPPLSDEWYVIVPPPGLGQPYFHYGMDSLAHFDIAEYVKWIKHLAELGLLPNW